MDKLEFWNMEATVLGWLVIALLLTLACLWLGAQYWAAQRFRRIIRQSAEYRVDCNCEEVGRAACRYHGYQASATQSIPSTGPACICPDKWPVILTHRHGPTLATWEQHDHLVHLPPCPLSSYSAPVIATEADVQSGKTGSSGL